MLFRSSAASTNAAVVKASAGRVLGWQLANTTASWVYVKLHNQTTTPTAGAGVLRTIAIPPNGKSEFAQEGGIAFTTGIGLTTTAGAADAERQAARARIETADALAKMDFSFTWAPLRVLDAGELRPERPVRRLDERRHVGIS